MTDYTPIDCGLHSRYELAVMHRQPSRISWRDEQGDIHMELLTPCDLLTRAGAEYLVADSPDGRRLELRLDRIQHFEPR
jgi:transcriptional antiterminator Rof (Rho-off)